MTILEDLYYGNIVPAEKGIKKGGEYSKLLNLAARNEEKLSDTLTKEQKILFEKYKDCTLDMYGISEKEAFVDGVKLGVKIIVETHLTESQNFNSSYKV